jgi:hypothetical protein
MDINRLSDTRKLLPQLESKPNIDQIVAHGVMSGDTDIYTYVPNEAFNEESLGHSSASLSRRSNDNSQHASYQREVSSHKLKAGPSVSQAPASSGSVIMPILTRSDAPQIPWTCFSPQPHGIYSDDGMLQQHSMHSSAPPEFVLMNPVLEDVQGGRLGFQPQMSGTEYAAASMGMVIDNMDLDPVTSNLWWDQPFETIPTEQYGVWYPEGYPGADMVGYYIPEGQA